MRAAGIPDQGKLATAAGVSRETVNTILNQRVDADEGTLAAIATACGVPAPSVEWRFIAAGSPQEPRSVVDWIDDAAAALAQAKRGLVEGAATLSRLDQVQTQQGTVKKKRGEEPEAGTG